MFAYKSLSVFAGTIIFCSVSFSTTLTLLMPIDKRNISREFPPMLIPQPTNTQRKQADFDWARDREQLKNILNNQSNLSISDTSPQNISTPQEQVLPIVRVLDFSDSDSATVKIIMDKYSLVTSRRYMDGSPGQNIIGTTIDKTGTHYYSHGTTRPGYYDVFEFSEKSLKHLTSCEEKAIMEKNISPKTAIIEKIVFGIVKDKNGNTDLGVKNILVKSSE